MEFEWDDAKNNSNIAKHGISFEDASLVFHDPNSITQPDPDHSSEEFRFVTIGICNRHRVLVVAHTERGDRIRIISARKATLKERKSYGQGEN